MKKLIKTMTPKELKALQKEEIELRHKIDEILNSKTKNASLKNWGIINRLVEVNILLEQECGK